MKNFAWKRSLSENGDSADVFGRAFEGFRGATFSGKKTQGLDPEDSVFAPRTLSLFGEKSERGRLGCGMGSAGRAIIVYNRRTFADFGVILVKVGFRGQLQGLKRRLLPHFRHS